MDKERIKNTLNQLNNLCNSPNTYSHPIHPAIVANLKDSLLLISEDIKNKYPGISNRLIKNRGYLFVNNPSYTGNVTVLNPYRAGSILEALYFLLEPKTETQESLWNYIHPLITKPSKELYLNGHYTNAAEDAFIEVNSRLKEEYNEIKPEDNNPPDGVDLMHKMFAGNPPIFPLRFGDTQTDKNIQEGFHFMFAGAMSALRNPKAHSNDETISAEESLRRLMFASMLMYAVDDAKKNNLKSKT